MTMPMGHRVVGVKLAPSSYDALSRRAAADGRSLSGLAKQIVLSNLGVIETPERHFTDRGLLRRTVTRMNAGQRADYRTFVTAGFSAADAIEKVLGEGWRERG